MVPVQPHWERGGIAILSALWYEVPRHPSHRSAALAAASAWSAWRCSAST